MKKKTIFILLLLTAVPLLQMGAAQTVTMTVTNPTALQRQEVAEADLQAVCRLLGVGTDEPLTVRNALRQEVTHQKSHDGRLLVSVALQPRGKAVYTITKGRPTTFKPYVFGRVYAERLDDLTWENDRGIYRFYGPALQRTGERSFGTDVWVKNTPELVAEHRYRLHMWGWHKGDSLKKAGMKEVGEECFLNTTFHLNHGEGMDAYSVGSTLGCGTPALMKDGQLVFPYCYENCQILDNGPLRFTAELTYGTTADGVTEHRRISLDKGSHFNRIIVWYEGIRHPMALATGVVLHGGEEPVVTTGSVLYADPTDNPRVHQSQIYVGTLYPAAVDEAVVLEGTPRHAIGIVRNYDGRPFTYYFGSAWSCYDVSTMAHWRLLADEQLQGIRQPLIVEVE